MKISVLILIVFFASVSVSKSQILIVDDGETVFFSRALLLDVSAVNKNSKCSLNVSNGELFSEINLSDFTFEEKLMQIAFNNEYVHSSTYPVAKLNAKIDNLNEIEFYKPGKYYPQISGIIEIHGIKQPVTINAVIIVDERNVVRASALFNIKLNLFNIMIPSYNIKNISNDILIKTEFNFYDLLYSNK